MKLRIGRLIDANAYVQSLTTRTNDESIRLIRVHQGLESLSVISAKNLPGVLIQVICIHNFIQKSIQILFITDMFSAEHKQEGKSTQSQINPKYTSRTNSSGLIF